MRCFPSVLAAIVVCGASAAFGSTINVDFGGVTYIGTAVAPDTGTVWNNVLTGTTNTLAASDGTSTGVGITVPNATPVQGITNQPVPVLAPNLLRDYFYKLGTNQSTSVTLSGLTAPTYDVYVIAQNAVYGDLVVDYTIGGVTKRITNAGNVASFQEGVNWAKWLGVAPSSGEITVSFGDVNTANATSIAGLQLVAVPEPSGFVLLAGIVVGPLAYAWRKRR